ncbi:TonB-dependent receptor [Chitinophaga caseinilytica]|uniref:TonB-dependent receptor n=1 Tax=Chitinophaga caseinilytica TaxID=2267521 RepID=A0ABZ2ZBT9_9BACT
MKKVLPGLLLLAILPLQVFAWNWRTRISVSLEDQPLYVYCDHLEKTYGIPFSYSRDVVNLNRRMTLRVRDMPLREVLDQLFADNGIQYRRIGGLLVLAAKQPFQRTISGYVEDAATGEKLIGATVYAPHLKAGTVTNNYGFYSFTTLRDTLSLFVSYTGYNAMQVPVRERDSKQLNFKLSPSNTLGEVEVSETLPRLQDQTQMSKVNVNMSQTKTMPRILGEADVLRSIQAMPGVSGGMEGTSGIHVRGGSPDQNLILLDGTPVYNSTHLFGVFSVFNPDVIKNVDLYKGAFPARYGGRLSSVVDISMKDGDMYNHHGELSIGLLASRMAAEGPIVKGKTSYILTARRTYADLLLQDAANKELKLGEQGEFWAYFYDANLKINHIFSPKDRLYLSAYGGEDNLTMHRNEVFDSVQGAPKRYHEEMKFRLGWGNQAYALRWNHIFNPQLFSNVTVNYSQFRFNTDYTYKYMALDTPRLRENDNAFGRYYSKVDNLGAKIDFDYRPNPSHIMRFGAQGTWHVFRPGITAFNNVSDDQQLADTTYNDQTHGGVELSLYFENDWKIRDSMHLNLGVHASAFLVEGRAYTSIQPRLGFRYMLPRRWALKMSYTVMTQYIHLLTNNAATFLPTDLWVAATDKVPPMHAQQLALGLAKTTNDNRYEMSVEGYYKRMENVIQYQEQNADFNSATKSWEDLVVVGRGWSYGTEVLLQKKQDRFKGWIGYTLAWSRRAFPNINQGRVFPYKYDRRHELEVVLTQQLGKRWEVSAQWQYASGLPLTLPVASYENVTEPSPHMPPPEFEPGTQPVDVYRDQYTVRMHDVHRLDLGATYTKQRKKARYMLSFGLYNTYNRKNPFFYYYKHNPDSQKRELTMLSILPVLPSVSWAVRF